MWGVYCHPIEAYKRPPFIIVGVPRLPAPGTFQTFPQGKSLVSVTVVGDPACSDADLEARVRSHLSEWFETQGVGGGEGKGSVSASSTDVTKWRYLRTYRVPYAQPAQKPPVGEDGFYGRGVQVQRGIFLLHGTCLALSSNDRTLVHGTSECVYSAVCACSLVYNFYQSTPSRFQWGLEPPP